MRNMGGKIFALLAIFLVMAQFRQLEASPQISSSPRFEHSLIQLSSQNKPQELAEYIYYQSFRGGLAGQSFYNAITHLRANNPEGIPVLKLALDAAIKKGRAEHTLFLGPWRYPIMVIFELVDEQIELERLLCAQSKQTIISESPQFIERAIEKAGLIIKDTDRIKHTPLVHLHVAHAKYWALKRCSLKTLDISPIQSIKFHQTAERYLPAATNNLLAQQ